MVINGKVMNIDTFSHIIFNKIEVQLTDKLWERINPQIGDIISLNYDKVTDTAFDGYVIKRGRNGKN